MNKLSKNRWNIIFVTIALLAIGLACGGGAPKAEDEKQAGPEFVGAWTSKDGSSITIRSDGSADYKIGGTSVTGGKALVSEKEKTLRVAMLGMGSPMKIDKAPANGEMTIDGVVYKKDGGSTSSSDTKLEIPSNDKLQTLVKTTMLDFNDAIQSGDFSDFHKKTAKVWRDTSSPDEMKEAFKTMVDNKDSFDLKKAISSLDATFSPAPSIGKTADIDAILVKGSYPTKPKTLHFDLKYAMDDGTLKLVGINISTKNE
ncbi:MAG: hypothetical protein WBC19_13890 [Pyrinomonadaceae bacterium]|nr:hypothetical protein [Chloracidobacterium sp.]